MIGRGVIEDVDGTPEELRVATLLRMDKKYHPGVQDTMTLPPSANEVNIASTDSLCREDSGYSRAYYTAVGRAQERLVVENADALEDVESTVADITVVVDEYVMRDTR